MLLKPVISSSQIHGGEGGRALRRNHCSIIYQKHKNARIDVSLGFASVSENINVTAVHLMGTLWRQIHIFRDVNTIIHMQDVHSHVQQGITALFQCTSIKVHTTRAVYSEISHRKQPTPPSDKQSIKQKHLCRFFCISLNAAEEENPPVLLLIHPNKIRLCGGGFTRSPFSSPFHWQKLGHCPSFHFLSVHSKVVQCVSQWGLKIG